MAIDDVGRCRASTMRAAMFGLGLCGSWPAFAATLGDIAAALAAPAVVPQATNDWKAFTKLAGAKWQGKAPAKGGNKHYWNGKVQIDGVGSGQISLVLLSAEQQQLQMDDARRQQNESATRRTDD